MADTIRCLNLVLGYKDNRCKGYKWILAILKLRGLVKIKKDKGRKGSVRLSVKRSQLV